MQYLHIFLIKQFQNRNPSYNKVTCSCCWWCCCYCCCCCGRIVLLCLFCFFVCLFVFLEYSFRNYKLLVYKYINGKKSTRTLSLLAIWIHFRNTMQNSESSKPAQEGKNPHAQKILEINHLHFSLHNLKIHFRVRKIPITPQKNPLAKQ